MLHRIQVNMALGDNGSLSGEADKGLGWNENYKDMDRSCIAMRTKLGKLGGCSASLQKIMMRRMWLSLGGGQAGAAYSHLVFL